MKYLGLLLLSTLLSSCASAPKLTKRAEKVVFMRPLKGKCRVIKEGLHIVAFFNKRSSDVLRNKLMNETAILGGNVVEVVNLYRGSDQVIANAYHCPLKYIDDYKKILDGQ